MDMGYKVLYPMFKKERDNMEKTILVVEITKYSSGKKIYSIKKDANTLDKASEYLVSLKKQRPKIRKKDLIITSQKIIMTK